MKTEYKLLFAKIWYLVAVTLLVSSLLLPLETKGGQQLNDLFVVVGVSMALVLFHIYVRYGVLK